jgi:peptidoglycan/xylan/chitin deacetylase (PgdA/CDA1 family)
MDARGFVAGSSDVLCLCYHAVSPRWPAELSVTPESLSCQLERLARRGYRGVTFSAVAQGEVSGKVVAITFDDGYASVAMRARPILESFGMPATVFLPTEFIGGGPMSWPGIDGWVGTVHEAELVPMSWNDARELSDAGWEVGSHSRTHPRLTTLADGELERELVESRRACERMLEGPCTSLAYPYGDYDERVIAAARRAGYTAAAIFPGRMPEPRPLAWPRIGVFHHDSMRVFRLKVSPIVRRFRESAAWTPVVEPLRRIAGRSKASGATADGP